MAKRVIKQSAITRTSDSVRPARFTNVCFKCDKVILVGQLITLKKIGSQFKASHSDCFDPNAGRATNEELQKLYPDIFGTPEGNGIVAALSSTSLSNGVTEARAREVARQEAKDFFYENVSDHVKDLVSAYAPNTLSLTVDLITPSGVSTANLKNVHKQLPRLIAYAECKQDAYLWGEAGTGKTHAIEQVARLLGLRYGYISLELQTPPSRLVGYMTPDGTYISTIFRELYENGGVFCIDEVDNASGNLLTSLNSALGNNKGAFPDGMVKRHPNFYCFCTGNTNGLGGDLRFPERRVLDAAFRDRFVFEYWQNDDLLEEALTLQINPDAYDWLKLVQEIRKVVIKQKVRGVMATPRASYKGALQLATGKFTVEDCLEGCIFKGVSPDVKKRVLMEANPKMGSMLSESVISDSKPFDSDDDF